MERTQSLLAVCVYQSLDIAIYSNSGARAQFGAGWLVPYFEAQIS